MSESPTFRRRQLGIALRRLREVAGLDQAAAAKEIHRAASRMSRIEGGQQPITQKELATLLDLYKVPDGERAVLSELQAAGRQRSAWAYRDPRQLPKHFKRYLDVEGDAAELLISHVELIPGLVQTPEYSRALLSTGTVITGFSPQDVEHAVALRQERQLILSREDPVYVRIVVSEAALRRVIGGPAVMAAQLRHIVNLAAAERITVQTIPLDAGEYLSIDVPFTLIRFREDDQPSIAYLEGLASASHVEDPDGVRLYVATFNHLTRTALSPEESLRFIIEVANGYDQRR